MIERRHFNALQREEAGWLKARRHFDAPQGGCGCMRAWDDEEIAPNAGFALRTHMNVEIITYVREGTLTHRDNLGNEGTVQAGSVQVVSAGTGIRHAEYNLEQSPARIFQIWMSPAVPGGSPAWASQPCLSAEHSGVFVAIASGADGDQDALPIRTRARVLNARLKTRQSIRYRFQGPRLAYLVPSIGAIDVNGTRINARDGVAIANMDLVTIKALQESDLIMVDII
jgi:redox-sensitive bicupin YhaK (pirin superfamily)